MVAANPVLYKTAADLTRESATGEIVKKGEQPDHIVVIKHVPAVGDSSELRLNCNTFPLITVSERAIDEYYSELLMGGRNVMVSERCPLFLCALMHF